MLTATYQFARTFRQHNHILCVTDNCHGFTLQPVIVYCCTGTICCRTRAVDCCRTIENKRATIITSNKTSTCTEAQHSQCTQSGSHKPTDLSVAPKFLNVNRARSRPWEEQQWSRQPVNGWRGGDGLVVLSHSESKFTTGATAAAGGGVGLVNTWTGATATDSSW